MATQEITLKFRGDPSLLKGALGEIRREHASAMADVTRQQKAEAAAAVALQRQRSSALITVWKADTRAAATEERARARAAQQLQAQRSRALIAQWRAEARERERIARQSQRTIDQLTGALGFGGGAALGAIGVSEIRAGAIAWVNYASKLESTKIAFTTMLGSAQRATAHLKELQAFAIKTPFQFEELIDASQRMQALGFEAEQVIPVLTDVGNAVAAAGGGAERLDRVVLAISQMQSKGKVATQEMNQLAEAGIPGWKILEQQLGRSRAELVKMVEQGEISSAVFLDAFQKFSRVNFGGLMEKQAKTFAGAMSNIKDALLLTASTAFAPLFEKLTQTTLEIGRIGGGLSEAASGLARLTTAVGAFAGAASGLGNIPVPKIIEALLNVSGAKGVAGLLGLFGTPEIGPIGGTDQATKPTPLRSSEQFVDAEQTSALRAQSEEAKRIATERISEQERLFKLGQITREQETENIIAQLQIRASAEQQALNDEIARKHKELLANKDNAEKVSTIIEQVSQLERQIKSSQSELDKQIADKRVELQIQERRNLIEHQQARLAILLKTGETEIAAIEAEVQAEIKTRAEGIAKIEEIENAGISARSRLFKLELAQAGVEPADRQKVLDKIASLDVERTANAQKQAERRRGLLKQENADELELNRQLIAIRDAQREVENARIAAMLEAGIITESTAAARRLKVLTEEHEDRIALLNIESEHQTTTAERKLAIDNEKIASEIRYTAEVKRLTEERILAAEREAFSRGERPGGGPGGEGTPDDELKRQAAAVVGLELGPPPTVHFDAWKDAFRELREIGANAMADLAFGVGSLVQNWVLMGELGPKAVRKMVAAVLAGVAAQAAVKAIYELAEAFAALFRNPAEAAAHFTSAAIFGSIAGVAAVAGRMVAGNAFQQTTSPTGAGRSSGSASGSSSSVGGEPKPIDVDRRSVGSQNIVQTLEFRVKGGVVVDEWTQDYRLNGLTRVIIKSDGQG